MGYQRSVAVRTRGVTSHLRPLSRRCIAITAVPENAILIAVQINRDVAAYFGQPRRLELYGSVHSTDSSSLIQSSDQVANPIERMCAQMATLTMPPVVDPTCHAARDAPLEREKAHSCEGDRHRRVRPVSDGCGTSCGTCCGGTAAGCICSVHSWPLQRMAPWFSR